MNYIRLRGRVVSGLGEGAKYVNIYRRVFLEYLGIDPYPGTLNIDIGSDASNIIPREKAMILPPPTNGYGDVLVYRGVLNDVQVYVIKPVLTRHSWRILEVVSEKYLRKKLGLRDGDEVVLMILLD